MPKGRIVIAGGTGFIGRHLSRALVARGYSVTVLSRSSDSAASRPYEFLKWNGRDLSGWEQCISGAEAVVNLAGSTINCRMTAANRAQILGSRLEATSVLLKAVKECSKPPRTFIQSSAVGFYGDRKDPCDEKTSSGDGVLAGICQEWERVFNDAELHATRKVVVRLGVVLGADGGAFPLLYRLTRAFLGGAAGNGSQYMSWIHIADVEQILARFLEDHSLRGVFNLVAPEPTNNAGFMTELRNAMKKPWSPPVPSLFLRLGCLLFGLNSELILTGQNVVPRRLIDSGISFDYIELGKVLNNLAREREQQGLS